MKVRCTLLPFWVMQIAFLCDAWGKTKTTWELLRRLIEESLRIFNSIRYIKIDSSSFSTWKIKFLHYYRVWILLKKGGNCSWVRIALSWNFFQWKTREVVFLGGQNEPQKRVIHPWMIVGESQPYSQRNLNNQVVWFLYAKPDDNPRHGIVELLRGNKDVWHETLVVWGCTTSLNFRECKEACLHSSLEAR